MEEQDVDSEQANIKLTSELHPSALSTRHSIAKTSITPRQPTSSRPHEAKADSACTGHYMSVDDSPVLKNLRETKQGIWVEVPNGRRIQASHRAELDLPSIPPAAREAYVFSGLSSGSLISMGLLCDHGMQAKFTAGRVEISQGGKIVLQGNRVAQSRLWHIAMESP